MPEELNPQIVVHHHVHVNGKYRIQLERSAVKGVDGFRVEACSDSLREARQDAQNLYEWAILQTENKKVEEKK